MKATLTEAQIREAITTSKPFGLDGGYTLILHSSVLEADGTVVVTGAIDLIRDEIAVSAEIVHEQITDAVLKYLSRKKFTTEKAEVGFTRGPSGGAIGAVVSGVRVSPSE